MGRKLDQTLAVLNGLVGDYLARTGNGLATEMACAFGGSLLAPDAASLRAAYPQPTSRVVVLVHGVMSTEANFRMPDGGDYGSLLAAELGFTPIYVRYNSGRAIADNGAQLAHTLERLVLAYPQPIDELLLIGYSMGGLLLRSACHVAVPLAHTWLSCVRRAIYVGTPHLGAPAERVGRVVADILRVIDDPYTRLVADIGDLRSAGIKDLGDGQLQPQDRAQKRSLLSLRDPHHPLPLLTAIQHYLIAGTLAVDPLLGFLFGDSLVSVVSATYATDPAHADELLARDHIKVFPGISHLALAHHLDVYGQIKHWCQQPV